MYDLIILGDGAVANAIALEFIVKYKQKVCIIGKNKERHLSASMAASAMTNCYAEMTNETFTAPHLQKFKLSEYALSLWPKWIADLENLSGHKIRSGQGTYLIQNSLGGVYDQENFELINRYLINNQINSYKVDPSTLPLSPVSQYKPLNSTFIAEEGYISSHDVFNCYDAIFENNNVTYKTDKIKQLSNNGCIKIEFGDNSTITAKNLIIAAGFWSNELNNHIEELNEILPMYASIGSALELEINDHGLEHVYRTPSRAGGCGSHLVPITKDTLYFGATSYISMTTVERPTLYYVNNLITHLLHQFNKNYLFAKIANVRLGHRPFPLDKIPLVGSVNNKNIWLVTGFNRDGFHSSPAIATELAKVILNDTKSIYLPDSFSPLRKPHKIMNVLDSVNYFCEYHYSSFLAEFEPKVMASHDEYIISGIRNDLFKIYDDLSIDYGLDSQILWLLLRLSKRDHSEYIKLKKSITSVLA